MFQIKRKFDSISIAYSWEAVKNHMNALISSNE